MPVDYAELKRLAKAATAPMPEKRRRGWYNRQRAFSDAAKPQAILSLIEENERQGFAIVELSNALRQAGVDMDAISAAIGTVRFMDPPDGGDVSLAEQVRLMREENERMRAWAKRVIAWAEAQAAGHEASAQDRRFPSPSDAYAHDAANLRKIASEGSQAIGGHSHD